MKARILLLVIGFFMLVGCDVLTMKIGSNTAPDGFFGLKFGSTVEQAKELGLVWGCNHQPGGVIGCGTTKKQIGEVEIIDGGFYFYDNQFAMAIMKIDIKNAFDIEKALRNKYGKPAYSGGAQGGGYLLEWIFSDVYIQLFDGKEGENYKLSYRYLPIMNNVKFDKKTESDL